uniref:TNF superfamily member 9 n=1 Tax=Canis lupus dingo TaxID=286419 RepID=A0A8C0L727_CANLU
MRPRSDAAPDPEAPRPPAPPGRTCSPLPWALSAAMLLLAGTCAACALRAWVVPGPRPPALPALPALPAPLPDAGARLPDSPQEPPSLLPPSVQLKEGPLRWYSDPGLAGVFLGPGLSYDQHTRELMVVEPGLYYVFLHLKLQRVMSSTGSGSVSAALHLQPLGTEAAALDLTLDLPPPSSEARDSAAGFQGSLLHLDAGQRLRVHLRAEAGAHPAWQLAQGATILGLFRVATKVPTGLPSSWPMDTGPGSPPLDGE